MHPQPVAAEGMPPALGPYSQAVRLGDLLFVSGQGGLDAATGTLASGGFAGQARQAFTNVARVLEAAGSDLGQVAKLTVFMANADDFPALNELFAEFFPSAPPTRSVPIVQLPRGLLISIEAIAAA
ncbi:MAG: 2-iminobutanoate/2-iminopropanoate deaminase [Gaiellales bacterium]|jgi:2-iminobutanoate/2-iminopropanoate deaminase|nr:2-iminobutanoate/2-iminopropanoate deaminase [Gaiellales bacterium]